MGIWERLGTVLKSYVNDGMERILGDDRSRWRHGDDDLNAAFEELDDFLKGEKAGESRGNHQGHEKPHTSEKPYSGRPVPPELKRDFAELGLSPGASEEECKEAYKKLLKIHHPDRYSNDPEMLKKATEKAARINAAYDRLVAWFKSGSR